MGLLDKLTGSSESKVKPNTKALDGDGNVMDPCTITDPSDIAGVKFVFDSGRDVEVRRAFGSWECITCKGKCNHGRDAKEVMENWVNINS